KSNYQAHWKVLPQTPAEYLNAAKLSPVIARLKKTEKTMDKAIQKAP
ncbi:unnamed protein product, partial [marine sediment metagenome]